MTNAIVHERELRRAECAAEIVRAAAELQAIDDERACATTLSRSIESLFPDHQHAVLIWPEDGAELDGPLIHPADDSLGTALAEVPQSLDPGQH